MKFLSQLVPTNAKSSGIKETSIGVVSDIEFIAVVDDSGRSVDLKTGFMRALKCTPYIVGAVGSWKLASPGVLVYHPSLSLDNHTTTVDVRPEQPATRDDNNNPCAPQPLTARIPMRHKRVIKRRIDLEERATVQQNPSYFSSINEAFILFPSLSFSILLLACRSPPPPIDDR